MLFFNITHEVITVKHGMSVVVHVFPKIWELRLTKKWLNDFDLHRT